MVISTCSDDQSKKMHIKLCKMHKLLCVSELTNTAEKRECKSGQATKKQGDDDPTLWRYKLFRLVLNDQPNDPLDFTCGVVLDKILQLGELIARKLTKLYSLSSRFRRTVRKILRRFEIRNGLSRHLFQTKTSFL